MDSDSGVSDFFGMQTKKVIAIHPMSRVCIKCKRNKSGNCNNTLFCSRNYQGTAKGMEAHGALQNVMDIWNTTNKKAYIAEWVADEDSSSAAVLQWDYKEAVKKKKGFKWPLTKKGNKRKCYGQLPIDYPVQPIKYNDGNHAINAFCSPIFALARGKGKKMKNLIWVMRDV